MYAIQIDSYTTQNTKLMPMFVCQHLFYPNSDRLDAYTETAIACKPKTYATVEEASKVVASIELALKYEAAHRANPDHFTTNPFHPNYQPTPSGVTEMRDVCESIIKFHEQHTAAATKPFHRLLDLIDSVWKSDNVAANEAWRNFFLCNVEPSTKGNVFEHSPLVMLRVVRYEEPVAEPVMVSYERL